MQYITRRHRSRKGKSVEVAYYRESAMYWIATMFFIFGFGIATFLHVM